MLRAALLSLLLAACAVEQPARWVKPGGTQYELDNDVGQCRAQAFSVAGSTLQMLAVQQNCLIGKGWRRVR